MSDQDQHSCFTNGDHSPNSDSSISPQSSLVGALESISTIPYPQEPNLSFDTLRDQSSLSPSSSPTNSAISVVSTIINQPHPSLLSHIMDQHSQEQAQSLDWFQQFLQAYTRTQLAQTEALVAQQKRHDELMSLLPTCQSILPADNDSNSETEHRENLKDIAHKLDKLRPYKEGENLNLFLNACETRFKTFHFPKSEWKSFLSTKLTPELVDQVVFEDDTADYDELKSWLLDHAGLTDTKVATDFHSLDTEWLANLSLQKLYTEPSA